VRSLFCVLGDPVDHSRSPALMSRAFALLGVDAAYAPCRVLAEELPEAVRGLQALGARGFNVTVPHKARVLELCDRVAPEAARIGAVNCVSRNGSELVGHNTDAPGLLRALRADGVLPADESKPAIDAVAIVGAGGSARAAALALAGAARRLWVLNRTASKAQALAQTLRDGGARADAAELGSTQAESALAESGLVVHCSTVGMGTSAVAFDVGRLDKGAAVADLVYAGPPGSRAGDTALLAAARARGLRTVDGLDVLVHQAILSLEIWLGRPRLDSLAAALREAAAAPLPAEVP
jgi:shikimate dehydrogenase